MSHNAAVNTATFRKVVTGLCRESKAKTVVEIGIYTGKLSVLLLDVKTVQNLYLVDPWVAYAHYNQELMDSNYEIVQRMFDGERRVTIMRMTSEDASKELADNAVDFVNIDGDHEEKTVKKDIEHWWPKLRDGGLMTGDNYELEGVAAAVDSALPARQLVAKGRVWCIRK